MARKSASKADEVAPGASEIIPPGGISSTDYNAKSPQLPHDYPGTADDASLASKLARTLAQNGIAPPGVAVFGVALPVTSAAIAARAEVCRRVAVNAIRDLEHSPADNRLVAAVAELEALSKIIPELG